MLAPGPATLIAALASLAVGCGPDLGKCDVAQLGGSTDPAMAAPHTGQKLVNQYCAAGRCHSSTAKGQSRVGAPAELNFDVVPSDTSPAELARITRAATSVGEQAEQMWGELEEAAMPPAGSPQPKGIEKEAIRNWLACGAEVIAAPAMADAGADPWTKFYAEIGGECVACHSATSVGMGTWMAMDACSSYDTVVAQPTTAGLKCEGKMLVVRNDPDASVLLNKLEGKAQCGALMPLGATVAYIDQGAAQAARAKQLRDWIMAGAPKPPSCP